MAAKQRFSEYEAVILLEGLLDYLDGKLTKIDAIRRVSHDLRAMAVNQGEKIDNAFRNEGGMGI